MCHFCMLYCCITKPKKEKGDKMYKILFSFILLSTTLLMSATIIVKTLADENVTNGECSLREAIVSANTNVSTGDCDAGSTGVDVIKLEVDGVLQLLSKFPTITDSVKIVGRGIDKLFIQGYQSGGYENNIGIFTFEGNGGFIKTYEVKGMTLYDSKNFTMPYGADGNGTGGCLNVSGYVDFTLDHVKIDYCESYGFGGGISFDLNSAFIPLARSQISIMWSEITNNSSYVSGGGIDIVGDVNLSITNTTIAWNTVGITYQTSTMGAANGGGLSIVDVSSTGSNVYIDNSTISGNSIRGHYGGGIDFVGILGGGNSNSDISITNSTIVDNTAHVGIYPSDNTTPPPTCSAEGAGIAVRASGMSMHLGNNIISGNKDNDYNYNGGVVCSDTDVHADFYSISLTTGGTNILGIFVAQNNSNTTFTPGQPNADNDYMNMPKPALKSLDYYGGFNRTMPPLDILSTAVKFSAPCTANSMDQRGYRRSLTDDCHIGSVQLGSYPISDYDDDNFIDADDAFPLDPLEWLDTDGDGTGNNADSDDDGDGLSDVYEIGKGLDPLDSDSDNDNVNDGADAFPLDDTETVDTDGDGIGNNADTDDDGDGYSDALEISEGSDPLDANSKPLDTDDDGTPNSTDTDDDNDGISDIDEVTLGFNPLDASDGLADSDGDGFSNAMEFSIGTNMNDVNDKPIWTPILMGDIMIFVPAKAG